MKMFFRFKAIVARLAGFQKTENLAVWERKNLPNEYTNH